MKALRIAQLVVVVLLLVYLWIVHSVNPDNLQLPLLLPMRPAVVILLAVLIAYFVAWLPAQARVWRLKRHLKGVTAERDALASRLEPLRAPEGGPPIIPDRIEPFDTSSDEPRRGDDPTDYL